MIRLVTQFDRPTARSAAATPSCCGGCCCCCCCVVTLAASSIYLAVSSQRTLSRAREEAPERIRLDSPLPGLIGFFAAPAALLAMYLSAVSLPLEAGILAVGLAAWYGMIGLAYWGAGHRSPWLRAAIVVVLCSILFVVEFVLWASSIETA